jgi:hypothetical protein
MHESYPDFTGKVVVLYFTSNVTPKEFWASDGIGLYSPRFQIQGDRLFLIGKKLGNADDWALGCDCAVAWDSIFSYLAMPPERHQQYPNLQPFIHPNYQN